MVRSLLKWAIRICVRPLRETMAYPNRTVSGVEPLDFFKIKELTFIEPDF